MKINNNDKKGLNCSKNNILERSNIMDKLPNVQNKENVENESISNMIEMLKEYENLCIQRQDFAIADEVKNKIQFLKKQANIINKELMSAKEQQNIAEVCREGEEQIKKFQMYWDSEVQELIANLKEVQEKLCEQQKIIMIETEAKLVEEQPAPIKYSSKVLQLRKHLSSLIKMRRYKQAQNIKNELKIFETNEQQRWVEKFDERKKYRLQQLEKKQNNQLQALRIKLQGIFNEKIHQRDAKFQILLKKNRKRRIDSSRGFKDKKNKLSISYHQSGTSHEHDYK